MTCPIARPVAWSTLVHLPYSRGVRGDSRARTNSPSSTPHLSSLSISPHLPMGCKVRTTVETDLEIPLNESASSMAPDQHHHLHHKSLLASFQFLLHLSLISPALMNDQRNATGGVQ
jgi:hypothetical protein